MFPVISLARYVLWHCTNKGEPVSNLKLGMMLCFIWAEYYRDTRRHLFQEEIRAWQVGPVIPILYCRHCHHACLKIHVKEKPDDSDAYAFLEPYIDRYRTMTISQLTEKVTQPGTPWHTVYHNGIRCNPVIPFSLIEEYSLRG